MNQDNERSYYSAKKNLEALMQEAKQAETDQRFDDAARLSTECLEARQRYVHVLKLSKLQELSLWLQHTRILLQCCDLDRFHIDPPPDGLNDDALNPDPVPWGNLCFNIGLLYFRYSKHQHLGQAKYYLDLALQSHMRAGRDKPLLAKLCQMLLDIYNLTEDTHSAMDLVQMVKLKVSPNLQVYPGQIRDVNVWCENEGFNLCLLYRQESLTRTLPLHKDVITNYFSEDLVKKISPMEWALQKSEPAKFLAMLRFTTTHTSPYHLKTLSLASELLLRAADTQNAEYIQPLLEAGADLKYTDKRGRTALQRCQHCPKGEKKKGGTEVARRLLERERGLLDSQDNHRKTALFMASEEGNVEMIKLLRQQGANPALSDIHQKTALHELCHRGDLLAIRALLEKPISASIIDQPGPKGETPLIIATRAASTKFERLNVVKELIENNADPLKADKEGNNAFHCVSGPSANSIKAILRIGARGANRSSGLPSSSLPSSSPPSFSLSSSSLHSSTSWSKVLRNGRGQLETSQSPRTMLHPQIYSDLRRQRSVDTGTISTDRSSWSCRVSISTGITTPSSRLSVVGGGTETIEEKDEDDKSLSEDDPWITIPEQNKSQPTNGPGDTFQASERLSSKEDDRVCERTPSSEEHDGRVRDHTPPSEEDEDDGSLDKHFQGLRINSPAFDKPRGAIREHPNHGGQSQRNNFGTSTLPYAGSSGYNADFGVGGAGGSQDYFNGRPPNNQGDDGQAPSHPRQDANNTETDEGFACHFAKAFPSLYPSCFRKGFKRQRDIKRHLITCHWKPYCPGCFETFKKEEDVDKNIHPTRCRWRSDAGFRGLTNEQKTLIENISCLDSSHAQHRQKWFQVFRIVFGPARTLPSSPYALADEPTTLDEFYQLLQEGNSFYVDIFRQWVAAGVVSPDATHNAATAMIRQLWVDLRPFITPNRTTPSNWDQSSGRNTFISDSLSLGSIPPGSSPMCSDLSSMPSGADLVSSGGEPITAQEAYPPPEFTPGFTAWTGNPGFPSMVPQNNSFDHSTSFANPTLPWCHDKNLQPSSSYSDPESDSNQEENETEQIFFFLA